MHSRLSFRTFIPAALVTMAVQASGHDAVAAAVPAAEIRISEASRVPACVTPERLMAFVRSRNDGLEARFADVARWYKHYGEAWRVRWDYAFFQMVVETNALRFRRGDGSRGDVRPEQNNFAGIGTTGGGVPGDAFPDVKTGVLGHIQHLVAYSGERLAAPVAPRTRAKQDDIISASSRTGRPVRFSDLARRWAVDRRYGQSIEAIADSFRKTHCTGRETEQVTAAVAPAATGKGAASPAKPLARTKPPTVKGNEPKLVARPALARAAATKGASPADTRRIATRTVARDAATVGTRGLPAGPAPTDTSPPEPPQAACSVASASYGGRKALLIRAEGSAGVRYVALGVLDGFEQQLADGYIAKKAPGGSVLAAFDSREAALARAHELCPSE